MKIELLSLFVYVPTLLVMNIIVSYKESELLELHFLPSIWAGIQNH